MNKHSSGFSTIELLLIVLAVFVLLWTGWYVYKAKNASTKQVSTNTSQNNSKEPTDSKTEFATFEGKITKINNSCASDGVCSITVGNKEVVTGGGLETCPSNVPTTPCTQPIYGNLGASGGVANFKAGQNVTVKALMTNTGYSLRNCPNCYIKAK